MSYFIPRPRHLNIVSGDLGGITWPAAGRISVGLRPADLFGASTEPSPRYAIVVGSSGVRVHFDSNLGRCHTESSTFLPLLELEGIRTPAGPVVSARGNTLYIDATFKSVEHLLTLVHSAEYYILPMLSMQFGTYVGLNEIIVEVAADVRMRAEISRFQHAIVITSDEDRRDRIHAALAAIPNDGPFSRFMVSALYFQQAQRLASGVDGGTPDLCASEILINLAKAIEILFGGSRDRIRDGCRAAGLTEAQIESQIIPILLARNQLDGAHPVGSPAKQDFVDTLRKFVDRAQFNVKSLLLRVHRLMVDGRAGFIEPFRDNADRARERQQLVDDMKAYLDQAGLTP
jgi:hypothetical protein